MTRKMTSVALIVATTAVTTAVAPADTRVYIPETSSVFEIDTGNCTDRISKQLLRGVYFDFTAAVAQSKVTEGNKKSRMKALFGSWVENGDEDKQLEELYKSRLIPSSFPNK